MLTVYSRGVPINSKKIEFNECPAAWHNLAFFKNYRIYDASTEVQPTKALVYSLKIILTFQHVFTLSSVGLNWVRFVRKIKGKIFKECYCNPFHG